MKQYCIYRRLLIVDEDDDLFVPFHLLMYTAIASVLESYEAKDNPFTSHNSQLLIWQRCNFKGCETWNEVQYALAHYVTNLSQYIVFVMVIPGIKSFLRIIQHEEKKVYIFSTLLSLESFMKYNQDTFCHYDLDIDICGFTAHSLASGCPRCKDNYHKLSSNKQHDKDCSYYTKILPNSYAIQQLVDDKYHELGLLQAAVINMYEAVIRNAEDGNGCVVLPPPTMTYTTQRRKKNSFMLCEFSNALNNDLFSVWLSKVETVNVSTELYVEFELSFAINVSVQLQIIVFISTVLFPQRTTNS